MAVHSRIAVIGFGGWGLQVMLHLWPRLRTTQEARVALGQETEAPDLDRLAAFATILPQFQGPSDNGRPSTPFELVRPNPSRYPPPFYVERRLELPVTSPSTTVYLTAAERRALGLRAQAERDEYVKPIEMKTLAGAPTLNDKTRPSRHDLFRCGLAWAEAAVRPLIDQVVHPTRLFSAQPEAPFVTTSIYVVASLAEPRASALIWPIIAEMADALRGWQGTRVFAILATGSFAQDDSRVLEEAAAHVALAELDAMAAFPGFSTTPTDGAGREAGGDGAQEPAAGRVSGSATAAMRSMDVLLNRPEWQARVGRRIFERVYLLDREMSNLALAASAVDQAVLAANAIEAFLVGRGEQHVDAQIIADEAHLNDRMPADGASPARAHYSLLGAACDYAPLREYLFAAVEEEQKRIVRAEVLGDGEDGRAEEGPGRAGLAFCGAAPGDAVRRLLRPQDRAVFELWSGGSALWYRLPAAFSRALMPLLQTLHLARPVPIVPRLRIATSFILQEEDAGQPLDVQTPWRWLLQVDQHIQSVEVQLAARIKLLPFQQAWGYPGYYLQPEATDDAGLSAVLERYRRETWSERYRHDDRALPAALYKIVQSVRDDILRHPKGLRRAAARLSALVAEVESVVATLERAGPADWPEPAEEEHERRLYEWTVGFRRAAVRLPHASAIWIRAVVVGLFVVYFVYAALLIETATEPSTFQKVLAGAGCGALTLLLGLAPSLASSWRMSRLRNRRVRLLQEKHSAETNRLVRETLRGLYGHLLRDVRSLLATVTAAIEALEEWSQPDESPVLPPADTAPVHLRRPQASVSLWRTFKQFVEQFGRPGATAQERFRKSWPAAFARGGRRQDETASLSHRLGLAIEFPLNAEELGHVLELEARRRDTAQQKKDQQTQKAGNEAEASSARKTQEDQPQTGEHNRSTQHGSPKSGEVEAELRRGAWCGYAPGDPREHPRCAACPNPRDLPCPFSEGGEPRRDRWSIQALIRRHAADAVGPLLPRNGVLPEQPGLLRPIGDGVDLERVLFSGGEPGRKPVYANPRAFVEEILSRAKPAGFNDVGDLSRVQPVPVEFGVTGKGRDSALSDAFKAHDVSLLASGDPTSISVVRTLHFLRLDDLALASRARVEYCRLHPTDRDWLVLLKEDGARRQVYGDCPSEHVPYASSVLEGR